MHSADEVRRFADMIVGHAAEEALPYVGIDGPAAAMAITALRLSVFRYIAETARDIDLATNAAANFDKRVAALSAAPSGAIH